MEKYQILRALLEDRRILLVLNNNNKGRTRLKPAPLPDLLWVLVGLSDSTMQCQIHPLPLLHHQVLKLSKGVVSL